MSNSNSITRDRIERLIIDVRHELSAFQLGRFLSEPIFGIVDLDLFGLRFKMVTSHMENDDTYTIIPIVKTEDIDSDKFLIHLAHHGYLRWLRQQISSHTYLKLLTRRNRYLLLLDVAEEQIIREKKGKYLLGLIRDLKTKPLLQIYHEEPEVFEWLLL